MSNSQDGFDVAQEHERTVSSATITVISGVVTPCEYSIELPKFHGIGMSPNFQAIVPTSYDFSKMRDEVWGPSTYGYLPPGMRQEGATVSSGETVNVAMSDAFFQNAARGEVNTERIDLRNLVGVHDPVGAHLMMSLGSIAKNDGSQEWPILVETIGTSLALRIMQMLGAKIRISNSRTDKMKRVRDYINDNLDKSLSLGDLSNAAGLSIFHFARQFKAETGQTPHEYVQKTRVQRAVHLLRRGELPLSMVALACGFSSQAHMTKAVKAATGITPGQHRSDAGLKYLE